MPVLSFPCVVTRDNDTTQRSPRRTWIKGHDLRTLALEATKQLALTPEQCEYMLFSPPVGTSEPASTSVFLEVVHDGLSALVGPMAGPTPPPTVSPERTYPLEDLLLRVGLRDTDDDGSPRAYPVLVTYAGLFREMAYPPPRQPKEPDAQYATRCATAERVRLDRTRHEGIHVVRYDIPPEQWTARDLDALLGLAYRLLPTMEPRWRDSGSITQETFAAGRGGRTPTLQYCLEVARGDYAAYLRLPVFPTRALAEWLGDRRCEINLCHPIVKIEEAARRAGVVGKLVRPPSRTP
jgi:hypothetical protein